MVTKAAPAGRIAVPRRVFLVAALAALILALAFGLTVMFDGDTAATSADSTPAPPTLSEADRVRHVDYPIRHLAPPAQPRPAVERPWGDDGLGRHLDRVHQPSLRDDYGTRHLER